MMVGRSLSLAVIPDLIGIQRATSVARRGYSLKRSFSQPTRAGGLPDQVGHDQFAEELAVAATRLLPSCGGDGGRPEGVFSAQTTRSSRSTFSATAIRFSTSTEPSSCRFDIGQMRLRNSGGCGEFRHGHAAYCENPNGVFAFARASTISHGHVSSPA